VPSAAIAWYTAAMERDVSGRIPLQRELEGLPELRAFPTDQQREAVLRAIAARHENPYDWQYWLWAAILVICAVTAGWATAWSLRALRVPGPIAAGVGIVAGLAVHTFLYRAVHRWAARPVLREELSKIGIPWPPVR
jgi:hypothetical protein